MHGWRKAAVWVGAFVVAVAAGAIVAAHSNPFPPGVDDGGAASSASPTPTVDHWLLHTTTVAAHVLHVGGTCRGTWILDAPLRATLDGAVLGTGTASLDGAVTCPFTTAQVAARLIPVDITGHIGDGAMVLVFRAKEGTRPAGSVDLAGYAAALPLIRLTVVGTSATGTRTTSVSDHDLGTYRSVMRAWATCMSCGPAPVTPSGPTTASP